MQGFDTKDYKPVFPITIDHSLIYIIDLSFAIFPKFSCRPSHKFRESLARKIILLESSLEGLSTL